MNHHIIDNINVFTPNSYGWFKLIKKFDHKIILEEIKREWLNKNIGVVGVDWWVDFEPSLLSVAIYIPNNDKAFYFKMVW